jgi:dihydropteroate synthase
MVMRAFATRYRGARAVDPDELASRCGAAGILSQVCPSMRDALGEAAGMAGDADLILVTGSLFAVAEARALLVGGV